MSYSLKKSGGKRKRNTRKKNHRASRRRIGGTKQSNSIYKSLKNTFFKPKPLHEKIQHLSRESQSALYKTLPIRIEKLNKQYEDLRSKRYYEYGVDPSEGPEENARDYARLAQQHKEIDERYEPQLEELLEKQRAAQAALYEVKRSYVPPIRDRDAKKYLGLVKHSKTPNIVRSMPSDVYSHTKEFLG